MLLFFEECIIVFQAPAKFPKIKMSRILLSIRVNFSSGSYIYIWEREPSLSHFANELKRRWWLIEYILIYYIWSHEKWNYLPNVSLFLYLDYTFQWSPFYFTKKNMKCLWNQQHLEHLWPWRMATPKHGARRHFQPGIVRNHKQNQGIWIGNEWNNDHLVGGL